MGGFEYFWVTPMLSWYYFDAWERGPVWGPSSAKVMCVFLNTSCCFSKDKSRESLRTSRWFDCQNRQHQTVGSKLASWEFPFCSYTITVGHPSVPLFICNSMEAKPHVATIAELCSPAEQKVNILSWRSERWGSLSIEHKKTVTGSIQMFRKCDTHLWNRQKKGEKCRVSINYCSAGKKTLDDDGPKRNKREVKIWLFFFCCMYNYTLVN